MSEIVLDVITVIGLVLVINGVIGIIFVRPNMRLGGDVVGTVFGTAILIMTYYLYF